MYNFIDALLEIQGMYEAGFIDYETYVMSASVLSSVEYHLTK